MFVYKIGRYSIDLISHFVLITIETTPESYHDRSYMQPNKVYIQDGVVKSIAIISTHQNVISARSVGQSPRYEFYTINQTIYDEYAYADKEELLKSVAGGVENTTPH